MKITGNIIRKTKYPIIALLLAMGSFLVTLGFFGVLGYGNDTILVSDLHTQYVGFIQMFLRALKGEQSFWYSFSVYLGSGNILTNAYYALNPFNLLYLIESVSIPAMTIVIITIKIGLAAMCFQIFAAKNLKATPWTAVFFSLCYALSGFNITLHFHIMWLDAIYMLPIIIGLIMDFNFLNLFSSALPSIVFL